MPAKRGAGTFSLTFLRNSIIIKTRKYFRLTLYSLEIGLSRAKTKYFSLFEVNMEFKERIRLLRREVGLTQRETAEKIGVTYRTYQNYEAGASMPQSSVLSRLARAFGVSMDMLTGDEKSASPTENEELNELLSEMKALFSGGKLRDEDKQYVIEALTEAFWRTKEKKNG